MMVTFQDVERKYHQAVKSILFNTRAVMDSRSPDGAPWYDHPTMAKWLEVSSKEFVDYYFRVSSKFSEEDFWDDISQELKIDEHLSSLTQLFTGFKNAKRIHFAGEAK